MIDKLKDSSKHREFVSQRRGKIVEIVRMQGYVPIEALAERFRLTAQTIRRDINYLADAGLVIRHHGGVGLLSTTENLNYSTRKILCQEEKIRIGRAVAHEIPNGSSLILDIGTTTEEVARALLGNKNLRVVTNNLNVAEILCCNETFEVIVAGGLLRTKDRGVIGEAAVDLINQFKTDYAVISVSGIDEEGALLDYDYREVRVEKAIIRNARSVYLAADHTKFGRKAMMRIGHISDIETLFTDKQPSPKAIEMLAKEKVKVVVADEEPTIENMV